MSSLRNWLISGCSSGFGESIARAALQKGDRVVVTCRGDASKRLADLAKAGAVPLSLDVTASQDVINQTVSQAVTQLGRLDVLVNNAGYVLQGACEELSEADERAQYETNVFGVAKLTRAVLPYFREQRNGYIFNISSHVGRFGRAGFTGYSGSKFALEGLSESLSHEIKPFGIAMCIIEPGDFRTRVLESKAAKSPSEQGSIGDYDNIRKSLRAYNEANSGKQPGDPEAAAKIIVDIAHRATSLVPLRLALGSDAARNLKTAYEAELRSLERWYDITCSTDFAP